MNPPLISLCLIIGNVEDLIGRCLDSFSPLADEIIVVRAIGNLTPDKSLEIAKERGAKTFEYQNKPEHDWPHVDDFGAARQMSFDQATGKFIFWTDSDDILDPTQPKAIQAIRGIAESDQFDVVYFPYKAGHDGALLMHPRLVRRGKLFWHDPIHETLKGKDANLNRGKCDINIIHAPLITKRGSHERNYTILQSIEKPTARHLYYSAIEARALGRIGEASKHAVAAIQTKELLSFENYDLLITMAGCAPDFERKEKILLEAVREDPCRRDALCLMTELQLENKQPKKAIAYAQMFSSLPEPQEKTQLTRTDFYLSKGLDLYTQALRANGETKEADRIMDQLFRDGGQRITVIHPTRGRPQQAKHIRNIFYQFAAFPHAVEYIFGFSEDDEETREALSRFKHAMSPAGLMNQLGGTMVVNVNVAAAAAKGKVILFVADDIYPCVGWDRMIWEKMRNKTYAPHVLHISDGHRTDRLLTIQCATKKFVEKNGYFLCPEYRGLFSDTEFSHRAFKEGIVVDGTDIVFEHDHPSFNKNKPLDDTYKIQNEKAAFLYGEEVFMRRNPDANFRETQHV